MRKLFKYWYILLIFSLLSVPKLSLAIARIPETPTQDRQTIYYPGQDHSYTVTFRGNGEAVVNARILFGNQDLAPLNKLSFRIPKVDLKNPQVYQTIFDSYCIRYDMANNSTCIEYQEPEYNNWWGQKSYFKAESEVDGDTLLITLPKPVKSQGWGSLIVYFRAFGYAKKSTFGNYQFDFETFKTNEPINNLTVGVLTDSDLYLKGVKGKVDYRFTTPEFSAMGQSIQSTDNKAASVDSYYQQIGQGQITKQAYNLAPLDSYNVKGVYSDSPIKLYLKDFIVIVFVVLAVIMVMYILFRKISSGKVVSRPLALSIGAGLTSATCIFLSTVIFIFLFSKLSYFNYGQYELSFVIFFLMVITAVFLLIVTAIPAFYLGKKFGLWWGLGTLLSTFAWLVVYLLLSIMVLMFTRRSFPPPIPLNAEKTMEIKNSIDSKNTDLNVQ